MFFKETIRRFKQDPKGAICSKLGALNNKITICVSTLVCKFTMCFKGITYGANFQARGVAYFFRSIGSKIIIGDNATFISSSRFNYRGLNHKCILQTSSNGNIRIGNNCGFSGVSIVSSIGVEIGDNVMCGANVMIGDRNDHEDKYPQFQPEKIRIQDNVWIGMNCVIMKGVTIGENSIIGANSIVTKDIPANSIAVGNPCRVIKNRE